MKKVFLFVVFALGCATLSSAQDNWGERNSSLGKVLEKLVNIVDSLSGIVADKDADKDAGIFVGTSYSNGSISVVKELRPRDSSIECEEECSKETTRKSFGIKPSIGFRIGWQFEDYVGQVALASHQWQTEIGEVQNHMLIYYFIYNGFFAGVGLGLVRFDSTAAGSDGYPSSSAVVGGLELGYQVALGDLQFSIGGYLHTSLSPHSEETEESIYLCNDGCEHHEAMVESSVDFLGFFLNLEIAF